jgi:hypothetical protein
MSSPASASWPRFRLTWWLVFALGVLLMLVTMFYTVENWRGKRAWDHCRRQLEAKGALLDWSAYIPAPVPDDQNVFKAPWMEDWFVKNPRAPKTPGPLTPPLGVSRNSPARLDLGSGPVLLAEIHSTDSPPAADQPGALLRLDDPAAPAAFLRLVLSNYAFGPASCLLVARPPDQLQPLRLTLLAGPTPSLQTLTNLTGADTAHLRLQPLSSNSFRLWRNPDPTVSLAANYLAWSEHFNTDFDNMRQALSRPLARMEGDYQRPFETSIINFVHMREVAQTLSQRAQCYLLLGQPEAALRELTLLHDLSRLLDTQPTFLVSAMIQVAIGGCYTSVVADGLRLQAWREPQLATLQRQLSEVHLLSAFVKSLHTEGAAGSRTLETAMSSKLADLYQFGRNDVSLLDRLKSGSLPMNLGPRGWLYQNRANTLLAEYEVLEHIDSAHQLIHPQNLEAAHRRLLSQLSRFSPYTYLTAIMVPNCLKAATTTARNQTLANQAYLACALERHRLAHGEYPPTLDALLPQFADQLPHDLIGGRPLLYRRTSSGFLLYSLGWNEKDDGGLRRTPNTPSEADWVW